MDKELILKDVQPTLSQEQTDYVALSPQTGQQACANCQFFLATNYVHDHELGSMIPLGSACALVNGYPEPILATGWCKEWRLRQPYESEPMEVEIVDGDDTAADTPTEAEVVTEKKAYKVFAAPKDLPAAQKVMRSLTGELKPGLTIIRRNKSRYMLIVSSNGFKDRHSEHVATRALKEHVEGYEAGTVRRNKHTFWHRIPVGDIIAATMIDGFLVELAKEADDVLGKKFYDFVETHPNGWGDSGWGASQGFWVRGKDVNGKVYQRIDKEETATLPRDEAANEFTLSAIGDDPMAQTKFEKLTDEIFGNGAAKALEKGVGSLRKHLLADGKVVKDAATVEDAAAAVDEAETEMPTTVDAKDRLIIRLVDGMEALLTEVKDVLAAQAVTEEKAETAEEEIKSLRKSLDDQKAAFAAEIAEIREKMKMAPRAASQDSSTQVTDPAEIEKAKDRIAPKEVKLFGGLEIEADK